MSRTLSDLIHLPETQTDNRQVASGVTSSVERKDDTVTVEIKDAPGRITDAEIRAKLVAAGLDPEAYTVAGFRTSEWTMPNGDIGESKRYIFRERPASDVADDDTELRDIATSARGNFFATAPESELGAGFVMLIGDVQLGKGLDSDTPILTTGGWFRHGDLKVGMEVYGPEGKPVRVNNVLPTTERELFEVEFGDGTVIITDADHLWSGTRKYHTADKLGWEDRHFVTSTSNILEMSKQEAWATRPFIVDAAKPVEFPEKNLPIDPHLLGVWLGDGTNSSGAIAGGVIDGDFLLQYGDYMPSSMRDGSTGIYVRGLITKLKEVGLYKNKHVPESYLYSSVEQRKALVRGLMDTDGSVTDSGACEFTNTNEQIIESMMFLLNSLGVRARLTHRVGTLYGVEKKPYGRIVFRMTDWNPFTLERKASKCRESAERKGIYRSIREVRPIGKGEAQCITVEGSLYLAGKELVVTHNCESHGSEVELATQAIDRAVEDLNSYYANGTDITHVHIAWLGDHIEGFESQGGKNAWRTPLDLTTQLRVMRRIMMYAVQQFAPLVPKLTVAAVPGNHGRVTVQGGMTHFNDNFDTDCLVAVADACALNPDAFGHVEFFVPENDEMTVICDVAGTMIAHAHGHQWSYGKHFEWWQGQSFGGRLAGCDLLVAGHLHHFKVDSWGRQMFIQAPSLELESTWYRHRKGVPGNPGVVTMLTKNGLTSPISMISVRADRE